MKYYYSDGNKKYGPYTLQNFPIDRISMETLVWCSGLDAWRPAKDFPELQELFATAPPPLPAEKNGGREKWMKRNFSMAGVIILLAAVGVIITLLVILIVQNNQRELPVPDAQYYEAARTEEPVTIVTTNNAKLPSLSLGKPTELTDKSATIATQVVQGSASILREYLYYSIDNKKFLRVETEVDQRGWRIAKLIGLKPETKYYYKFASKTTAGYVYSDVKEFTTLPTPVPIDFAVTKHDKGLFEWIKRCNITGKNEEIVKACDYTNTFVRNKAVQVAGTSPGTLNLEQVCNIFDYCYSNWKYVNDSQTQSVIELASKTLKNGFCGDCDDFAVLVASMILSIGGEARISCAYEGDTGHAFAEVNVGTKTDLKKILYYIQKRYGKKYCGETHIRVDGDGTNWLNLDWWARHPGGPYYQAKSGTRFFILQQYCEEF